VKRRLLLAAASWLPAVARAQTLPPLILTRADEVIE
jgi:hypothetical protein